MAKATKYGVISDVHNNPAVVEAAINVLQRLGAEKLLVNGDIGQMQQTLQASQDYIAQIVCAIGQSGLEAFVQPGSHETYFAFAPVLEALQNHFPNIIDATKQKKAEFDDHHLVFLPGSDWNAGGEYNIGNSQELPTGTYIKTRQGLVQFESPEQYIGVMQKGIAQGLLHYENMRDLTDRVNEPGKTIVVCHVPRKFDDVDVGVDMAEFGQARESFYLQGRLVEQGSVFPLPVAQQIAGAGYPVEIKKENRGNVGLREVYEQIGITKAVTGHFHESGHRAHDGQCNPVPQGNLVDELYWNSGHLDIGQTGILLVQDGKVAYQNINIQDYLK